MKNKETLDKKMSEQELREYITAKVEAYGLTLDERHIKKLVNAGEDNAKRFFSVYNEWQEEEEIYVKEEQEKRIFLEKVAYEAASSFVDISDSEEIVDLLLNKVKNYDGRYGNNEEDIDLVLEDNEEVLVKYIAKYLLEELKEKEFEKFVIENYDDEFNLQNEMLREVYFNVLNNRLKDLKEKEAEIIKINENIHKIENEILTIEDRENIAVVCAREYIDKNKTKDIAELLLNKVEVYDGRYGNNIEEMIREIDKDLLDNEKKVFIVDIIEDYIINELESNQFIEFVRENLDKKYRIMNEKEEMNVFSYNGYQIRNPYIDEEDRFEINDPINYYGESYYKWIQKNIPLEKEKEFNRMFEILDENDDKKSVKTKIYEYFLYDDVNNENENEDLKEEDLIFSKENKDGIIECRIKDNLSKVFSFKLNEDNSIALDNIKNKEYFYLVEKHSGKEYFNCIGFYFESRKKEKELDVFFEQDEINSDSKKYLIRKLEGTKKTNLEPIEIEHVLEFFNYEKIKQDGYIFEDFNEWLKYKEGYKVEELINSNVDEAELESEHQEYLEEQKSILQGIVINNKDLDASNIVFQKKEEEKKIIPVVPKTNKK
jgi:hypothetical protein